MQCSFLSLLLLSILANYSWAKYSEELLIRLDHGGGVTGHYRTSHKGRGLLAFSNIPYAEAPIGQLRFSDPVKKKAWQGHLPSNRKDIFCPQREAFSRTIKNSEKSGDEDCLYLNVYVPQQPFKTNSKNLPVMVFIHGGGFTVGSGSLHSMDPEFLLDSDVILVTFNYRLGPLGFLSTYQNPLSGNWGLKDQQLVLQWVQENIHSFRGDKDKVTIFGVSAGGASVGLHMMSPASKGLFHRAIMQSGTPYDPWVLQDKELAISKAKKFIKLVGCEKFTKDQKEEELLKCLRKVPIEDITATAFEFYEWDLDPLVPFGPVLEESDSKNAFIRASDMKSIANPVPLIMGLAQDEGAFKSAILDDKPELTSALESKFSAIIPAVLCYSHYEPSVKNQITEQLKEFYLKEQKGKFNWKTDKHVFTQIVSDGLFVAGFDRFLWQQRDKQREKTYVYVFNYHGTSSFPDILANSEEPVNWGVSHGDDLLYMFPLIKAMAPHRTMSDQDLRFGGEFVRMLTDFAAHGDPVYSSEDLLWSPVSEKHFDYMRIGNCNRLECPLGEETDIRMLMDPLQERRAFWRELLAINMPYWERGESRKEGKETGTEEGKVIPKEEL